MEKSNYRLNEEHSTLVPETQWAKMYPNPININIKVPEEEAYDEDWGLRGQIIQLSVDIMQTIQSVKSTLSNILGEMPVLRMKLKTNLHSVLKDNETLAKYNISPGSVIELAVKERGGRRKY
jgi:splicing factor 3A subunit 1